MLRDKKVISVSKKISNIQLNVTLFLKPISKTYTESVDGN